MARHFQFGAEDPRSGLCLAASQQLGVLPAEFCELSPCFITRTSSSTLMKHTNFLFVPFLYETLLIRIWTFILFYMILPFEQTYIKIS